MTDSVIKSSKTRQETTTSQSGKDVRRALPIHSLCQWGNALAYRCIRDNSSSLSSSLLTASFSSKQIDTAAKWLGSSVSRTTIEWLSKRTESRTVSKKTPSTPTAAGRHCEESTRTVSSANSSITRSKRSTVCMREASSMMWERSKVSSGLAFTETTRKSNLARQRLSIRASMSGHKLHIRLQLTRRLIQTHNLHSSERLTHAEQRTMSVACQGCSVKQEPQCVHEQLGWIMTLAYQSGDGQDNALVQRKSTVCLMWAIALVSSNTGSSDQQFIYSHSRSFAVIRSKCRS